MDVSLAYDKFFLDWRHYSGVVRICIHSLQPSLPSSGSFFPPSFLPSLPLSPSSFLFSFLVNFLLHLCDRFFFFALLASTLQLHARFSNYSVEGPSWRLYPSIFA